ncbi:MAG TPA: Cache 3/Cache 2 fusion domain-containing protein [Methyloceanibacter sp.]|nr:Cache 3/Cache 2 fusion domain-containing protein [Methyloceanibacter sp.]
MQPLSLSLIAAPAAERPRARSVLAAGIVGLAFGFLASSLLVPSAGNAQDARVVKSMEALKADTAKLGAPKIERTEAVGGKEAPALYFGATKMNNNFAVVDEVARAGGKGMAATLLVKSDGGFIRVATNVQNPDGSGRAIGTALAGPALDSIKAGKAFFGEVPILGTHYVADYEPIKDATGAVIGAYFVGYKK